MAESPDPNDENYEDYPDEDQKRLALSIQIIIWVAIFCASLALSCLVSYWRSSAVYYKGVAERNEKNFTTLLDLQSDGIFVVKRTSVNEGPRSDHSFAKGARGLPSSHRSSSRSSGRKASNRSYSSRSSES